MFENSRRVGQKESKHPVDSLASMCVTLGVIAAGISLLVFEGLQIRFSNTYPAELNLRSEGVFTYFLVLFGTIMLILYVGLLVLALFAQFERVLATMPV